MIVPIPPFVHGGVLPKDFARPASQFDKLRPPAAVTVKPMVRIASTANTASKVCCPGRRLRDDAWIPFIGDMIAHIGFVVSFGRAASRRHVDATLSQIS